MRKPLWTIPLALLFAAIGTQSARADVIDTYTLSFGGANAPTAAPGTVLTYDATTGEFTTPTFDLTFAGTVLEMVPITPDGTDNPPTGDSLEWVASVNTGGDDLAIVDNTTDENLYNSLAFSASIPDLGPGSLTLTLASVTVTGAPEPSRLLLLGLGLLGVGVMAFWRRNVPESAAN